VGLTSGGEAVRDMDLGMEDSKLDTCKITFKQIK